MLYAFGATPTDAAHPQAPLTFANGRFYGTSIYGGARNAGTVFAITPDGGETVLHSFGARHDGANPQAGLIDVRGALYGTTQGGGTQRKHGDGIVFRIAFDGTETVLHNFGGTGDGALPIASLVAESDGVMYGMTSQGDGGGTVFSITAAGTEKVLHRFVAFRDGSFPFAALTAAGRVFLGTTAYGGTPGCGSSGCGTVFSVTRSGAQRVIHRFGDGGREGTEPLAGVIAVNGTLYGTTGTGGRYGAGTVYAIGPDRRIRVLHSFGAESDGANPWATLTYEKGILYGVTTNGVQSIFSITLRGGTYRVLHTFTVSDGTNPFAALIAVNGSLYGTTSVLGAHGQGTAFELRL